MKGTEVLSTQNSRVKILERGDDGTGLKVGPFIVSTPLRLHTRGKEQSPISGRKRMD